MKASLQIDNGVFEYIKPADKFSFSSIYCLKALGAFFVICIHSGTSWIFFPIIRTAVPFFFIISGFFLYKPELDRALVTCIKTFKKILWVTFYANLFYYLCYNIPTNVVPIRTLKSLIYFIFVGVKFSGHLWYLTAYIEALLVIMLAIKFKIIKQLWYLIPLFVIVGLITGKYAFLFPNLHNKILSRNFFTVGIPCLGIGWLLRKYSIQLLKLINYPVILVLLILLLSEFEIFILKYSGKLMLGDCLVTTIPLAASMVLSAVKYPLLGSNTLIEFIGKNYSTYIYIFHIFILRMFTTINTEFIELPHFMSPFIVFIFTILFIMLWQKCSTKFWR